MKNIDKSLAAKILDASNLISKNRKSIADHVVLQIETIDKIARELKVNRNEAILILEEYFNSKVNIDDRA